MIRVLFLIILAGLSGETVSSAAEAFEAFLAKH
jgi:hypothetical protein